MKLCRAGAKFFQPAVPVRAHPPGAKPEQACFSRSSAGNPLHALPAATGENEIGLTGGGIVTVAEFQSDPPPSSRQTFRGTGRPNAQWLSLATPVRAQRGKNRFPGKRQQAKFRVPVVGLVSAQQERQKKVFQGIVLSRREWLRYGGPQSEDPRVGVVRRHQERFGGRKRNGRAGYAIHGDFAGCVAHASAGTEDGKPASGRTSGRIGAIFINLKRIEQSQVVIGKAVIRYLGEATVRMMKGGEKGCKFSLQCVVSVRLLTQRDHG